MRASFIVPVFNEALALAEVLRELRAARPAYDICVVDDGSRDASFAIAERAGVVVLRHPWNLGSGAAMRTGYIWARDQGYDLAVQIDGDGQHDPRYLEAAERPILKGTADLVIGSRFLARGGYQSTKIRRAAMWYLSSLIHLRTGIHVTDPSSGFRLAGRRAIELFSEQYSSTFPEPEAIALAARHGLRIVEVPVLMRERQHGVSSLTTPRWPFLVAKASLGVVRSGSRAPKRRTKGWSRRGEER